MYHDRLDGGKLAVTREFLSLMPGARRSAVAEQLHFIEGTHANPIDARKTPCP
jgi:hypothetical protein